MARVVVAMMGGLERAGKDRKVEVTERRDCQR